MVKAWQAVASIPWYWEHVAAFVAEALQAPRLQHHILSPCHSCSPVTEYLKGQFSLSLLWNKIGLAINTFSRPWCCTHQGQEHWGGGTQHPTPVCTAVKPRITSLLVKPKMTPEPLTPGAGLVTSNWNEWNKSHNLSLCLLGGVGGKKKKAQHRN